MRHRSIRIFTLLLSLALAALPLQQAFASAAMDSMTAMEASHCQSMDTNDNQIPDANIVSNQNSCCCQQCDTACASHCAATSAMILPSVLVINDLPPVRYARTQTHTLTHATPPPSPPPLS